MDAPTSGPIITRRQILTVGIACLAGMTVGRYLRPPKHTTLVLPDCEDMSVATGGTYTLTLNGKKTKPLRFDCTAAEVSKELEAACGCPFDVEHRKDAAGNDVTEIIMRGPHP